MKHEPTPVALGDVAQTLMIPLWSRAIETERPGGLLVDRKAQEIVASLDFDFEARFAAHRRLAFRACLRTVMIDRWVLEFLDRHPEGTVVEIGTGLNTRFERVDNGRLRWFDVDLPDAVALRRTFFTDGPRRTLIEGAFGHEGWLDALPSSGPILFVAEAVLVYLDETTVRRGLELLGRRFSGWPIVFDTVAPRSFAERRMMGTRDAAFVWGCDDPRVIEGWGGHRLLDSVTLHDIPADLRRRLPLRQRLAHPWLRLTRPQRLRAHALNRLALGATPDQA
ncbi:class I SAM-dependent methyltransferase [Paraliomyxa miuraensis]|uniref:class I SAM-dependent methyltransferase n=1 Tax=Paraliomyxa miuraensis TaxID=376150 RepID=UPI0022533523|nr:class I SAM-dependent methyltransferase [Paraliomyxa miuraensis]MCX4239972.1 class I SAM-dependent methyltransferase [Paraliomyxa miuraensis]